MGNIRTEEEIISGWNGDISSPLVSICCMTFNHESFVDLALKGFLNQITDFPIEVLIHDDASTDGTAGIIKEYEQKYPRIIKPIYQKENQYSKGVKPDFKHLFPRVKGEFIALCEGDDYWIDPQKTSKQVNLFSRCPEITFVFSPAIQRSISKDDFIRNRFAEGYIENISIEWVVKAGGGFYPTCTSMFRASILENLPNWVSMHRTSDYPLAILARIKGRVGYIDDVVAVYNSHPNSVSHHTYRSLSELICAEELSYRKDKLFIDELLKENVFSNEIEKFLRSVLSYKFHKVLAGHGVFLKSANGVELSLIQKFKLVYHFFSSERFLRIGPN